MGIHKDIYIHEHEGCLAGQRLDQVSTPRAEPTDAVGVRQLLEILECRGRECGWAPDGSVRVKRWWSKERLRPSAYRRWRVLMLLLTTSGSLVFGKLRRHMLLAAWEIWSTRKAVGISSCSGNTDVPQLALVILIVTFLTAALVAKMRVFLQPPGRDVSADTGGKQKNCAFSKHRPEILHKKIPYLSLVFADFKNTFDG